MVRKILLACGVLAALIYIGSDIVAALRWEEYSYMAQSVSELRAIGAPTRAFLMPILFVYAVLELAFGYGVRLSAGPKRSLRITGALLVLLGALDLLGPLFALDLSADVNSLVNQIHIIITAVTVLALLLILIFGSAASGKWFRVYTIVTILLVMGGSMLTFMELPRVEAGLPTPWMGVKERVNIYAYMVWLAVLAVVLLRVPAPAPAGEPPTSVGAPRLRPH